MVKNIEPNIVQALQSFVGGCDGETFTVSKGDLFEADHPLVRKSRVLFGPALIRYPIKRAGEPRIEQATAAPGEKRGA